MYIPYNTDIYLYNVPFLDVKYTNVIDFETRLQQKEYFNSKIVRVVENSQFVIEGEKIILPYHKDELYNCNYLSYNNGYKTYYCFILSKEYISDFSTEVIVQLDVWSTYLFNHKLMESYVERTHVKRWSRDGLPTNENVDEGLNVGEMVLMEKEEIYKMHPNFVVCTSVPIGTLETVNNDSSSGGGSTDLPSNIQVRIVNKARELIGKWYVWGGNYPPLGNSIGTDCSGLCQWAYHQCGIKISRTTYTQIKEGKQVSQNEVQLADLIFMHFKNGQPEHVVLYAGKENGKHMCIEAPRTGLKIREREIKFTSDMVIRRLAK